MDSYTITWRDEQTRPAPPAFSRPTTDHRIHSLSIYAETTGAPDRKVRSLVRALKSCDGISEVQVTITTETETAVDF
jgi:hypothetical protein